MMNDVTLNVSFPNIAYIAGSFGAILMGFCGAKQAESCEKNGEKRMREKLSLSLLTILLAAFPSLFFCTMRAYRKSPCKPPATQATQIQFYSTWLF